MQRNEDKTKKPKKKDLDHEPSNAETSMKAKQGIGAYDEDEETAEDIKGDRKPQARQPK